MKKLYWRPQRLSSRVLLLLSLVAIVSLAAVESFRVREKQPFYKEKVVAAKIARQAFELIREERAKRNLPIDPVVDPTNSGLIGGLISAVTTSTGHLDAKQTSVNPNFAAVVVHLLKRAGVESEDTVAVGFSGSFPALNIATLAAIQALNLKSIVISSAGASQWGANLPGLLWPDMERALVANGLFKNGSAAISLGGLEDQAIGLSEKGRQSLHEAILENKYQPLTVTDFQDSIEKRMAIYREQAGGAEIRAYINVGGGTISVGTRVGKTLFKEGLNRYLPRGAGNVDSVMSRFATNGVPVIHLTRIAKLAERYGLPLTPRTPSPVGEGKIFFREAYHPWLGIGSICLILFLMVAFLRLDLAYRLFSSNSQEHKVRRAEPMV